MLFRSTQTLTPGSLALGSLTGLASNYVLAASGNTASITQAPLTIRGNDVTRLVNTSNPGLTATVPGLGVFSNGASIPGFTGLLVVTTTATPQSPIGTYAITPSGVTTSNYVISFQPGTLNIVLTLPGPIVGTLDPSNAVGSVAQSALVGGYDRGAFGPFPIRRSMLSGSAPDADTVQIKYGDSVSLSIRNSGMRLPAGVI